ncbi:alpha/beta hydrolase family protein [Maricaulis sp. CAU 1757]
MSRFLPAASAALVGVCLMAGSALLAAAADAETNSDFPVDAFSSLPHMSLATLSPDGEHIAFLTAVDEQPLLMVINRETRASQFVEVSEIRPESIHWADASTVYLRASDVTSMFGFTGAIDYRAIIAFDIGNQMEPRQLLRHSRQVGFNVNHARLVGVDPNTGELLIPAFDDERDYNLLAVDATTGRSRRRARGRSNTQDYAVGPAGELLARMDYDQERNRQTIFIPEERGWERILRTTDADRPAFWLAGQLPDGRFAVTTTFLPDSPSGDSRHGLYEFSLETGEIVDVIFEHDRFDLGGVRVDPYSNLVIGVHWEDVFREHLWFDETFADHQRVLDATFPDGSPQIQSWSADRHEFLIRVERSTAPPAYYLYTPSAGALVFLASARETLNQAPLPSRDHISYPVRDGHQLEAYLTRPSGGGPFPMVLLPHGGPESRDVGGFDALAHFLATRGYIVVQPNFRGSEGYGYRWRAAGFGQWGRGVMQHDLTDTVGVLVDAGLADPDRVCIVGASYGGYAALAGATFTPDLYRCAVSIAGVSDLPGMLSYTQERFGRHHWFVNAWQERFVGASDNSLREAMNALSPARHADAMRAPLLLLHGRDDSVVPLSQSRQMERAVRRAGGTVDLIELDNGDHWLSSSQSRREVFLAIESFLGQHLGE